MKYSIYWEISSKIPSQRLKKYSVNYKIAQFIGEFYQTTGYILLLLFKPFQNPEHNLKVSIHYYTGISLKQSQT